MDGAQTARRGAHYYYGWNIVALTVLAQLASFGIAINCLPLYLPIWSQDLHAPVSALAWCFTAPGMVFCLSSPAAGYAADKLSVRWMISLGLAGIALLFLLSSLVTAAWQLIALFATLAPVSMVIAGFVPCQALVSRWFERRRGMAIGLSAFGITLAGAILPPVFALALPAIGWRALFQIVAAFIAFVCVPLCVLLLRDRPREDEGQGFELSAATPGAEAASAVTIKSILARPNFWFLGAASVLIGFVSSGFLVNLASIAANAGMTTAATGALLSGFSLAALGATLGAGLLSDRLGGRVVLIAIVVCCTAGIAIAQFIPGATGVIVGALLLAVGGAAPPPTVALIAREFGAGAVGRAMGMIALLGVLGVTAPPVVASLHEATGGYSTAFLALIGVGVVALLVVMLLRDPRAAPAAVEAQAAA